MIDLDVDWLFSQPTWKIGSQTQREMVVRLKISDDKNLSEYSRFSIRKIFKITQNYSGDLNFDKLGYFENHIMYQKHIFIPNDIRSKNCKWIKVNVSRNTFCERFESVSKSWFFLWTWNIGLFPVSPHVSNLKIIPLRMILKFCYASVRYLRFRWTQFFFLGAKSQIKKRSNWVNRGL